MFDVLLYVLFICLYPERKDFIRMGLGIKARAKSKNGSWDKHLHSSRQFFEEQLEDANGTLLVLGSGRLFDFPFSVLKNFSRVVCIDADPLSLFTLQVRCLLHGVHTVECVCTDITGFIDSASAIYFQFRNSEDADGTGDTSGQAPHSSIDLASILGSQFDWVVSLNILSQIPIYFRDRLESIYKEDVLFEETCDRIQNKLQLDHLQQIREVSLNKTLITFDREFYHYKEDQSLWEEETSISDSVASILTPYLKDSWLWHVERAKDAEDLVGSIHRVGAAVLEKKSWSGI